MTQPLMPKATAVWLIDNTTLTFEQIGAFCGLHPLEVKGIADGEVAIGIKGQDPVAAGQLTAAEIKRCETYPGGRLMMSEPRLRSPERRAPGPRYTPVSKRQDRPNAIAWLVRYHPELSDAQVAKLVGTTKPTIQSVRDRSHWNISNITPQDPVTLGLSSQVELDSAVQKAQAKLDRQKAKEEAERAKQRQQNIAAAEEAGLPSAHLIDEDKAETAAQEAAEAAEPEAEVDPRDEAPLDPNDVFRSS